MNKINQQVKKYMSDKDYNFIYNKVPRLCVDIVIRNKHGILVLKRDIAPYKGKWAIPGGGVKFRETFEKAIQRISQAELGQKVIIHNQIQAIEFLREQKPEGKRHSVAIEFLCSLTKPDNRFIYIDGSENNILPEHKKFIKEYLKTKR